MTAQDWSTLVTAAAAVMFAAAAWIRASIAHRSVQQHANGPGHPQ